MRREYRKPTRSELASITSSRPVVHLVKKPANKGYRTEGRPFLNAVSPVTAKLVKEVRSVDKEDERKLVAELARTTPSANGEAPLPRRGPKGLLPSTWLDRSVRVEYVDANGEGATTSGALLELFPFGPVLRSAEGDRVALSWDRLTLIELQEN